MEHSRWLEIGGYKLRYIIKDTKIYDQIEDSYLDNKDIVHFLNEYDELRENNKFVPENQMKLNFDMEWNWVNFIHINAERAIIYSMIT